MSKNIQKYFLIAAILQIVWGVVPTASQTVIQEIPVELYIALRWSISGLIFSGIIVMSQRWKKISLADFAQVSGLGILGYGLASLGTLYGLKIGGVTNFALIGTLGPALTSLVSIWILKEKPQKIYWVALIMAIFGLLLLVIGKYQASSASVAGLSAGLILGAYFLEALVFVYSKHFQSKMGIIQYLAIAQLSSAFLMWTLQFFYWQQIPQLAHLSKMGWMAALFVSLVACVLGYVILYWLLTHVDGHRLSLFDGLHSLSATILGYLIFKEELKPLMLVGGGLILVSLVVGNYQRD